MKKLFVVLSLVISTSLCAQEKHYSFNIGLNRSWMIYDLEALNDYKTDFVVKPSVSINYEYAEYGNVSTSVGIRYLSLGRSMTLDYAGGGKMETSSITHYLLSLPLQLDYKIDIINTDLFVNAETAFILKSTYVSPSPINFAMRERNVTNDMNRFQFSIGGGLEYTFDISKEKFGVKTIINYILTKIPKDGEFKDEDNRVYSWRTFNAMEIGVLLSYHF